MIVIVSGVSNIKILLHNSSSALFVLSILQSIEIRYPKFRIVVLWLTIINVNKVILIVSCFMGFDITGQGRSINLLSFGILWNFRRLKTPIYNVWNIMIAILVIDTRWSWRKIIWRHKLVVNRWLLIMRLVLERITQIIDIWLVLLLVIK